VNIATGKKYTVNHVAYNNTATDIAVLVVNETNSTYLGLSSLRPDIGLEIVLIGNPNEQYGKVVTGTLGPANPHGFDKYENYMLINAERFSRGVAGVRC
jgi:hypothetical protein